MVHVIIKQTAKDKHIMFLLRTLFLICLKFNIYFKAKHLTSKENLQCDCLSLSKVNQFLQLAPSAMFKATFLFAFYGFLRVGEITSIMSKGNL